MDSVSRFHGQPPLITALIFLFRFLSRKNEKGLLEVGLVLRILTTNYTNLLELFFWRSLLLCYVITTIGVALFVTVRLGYW
ncbi:hypothetical protein PEDI_22660 [Persicobacter diffluens]|uniref:Uncharacterized protein n=1 Tax=Persicobacter diffluens TaxID=981 RepID=A0AAN4VYS1_9BACT|nr:hypothetical protein PEDI_22660 [Persicobacter diffluens]